MLERADGSAKWVQEGTAVLAAVHGPTQAGQRKEDAERAVIQVLFKPRNGVPGEWLLQFAAVGTCGRVESSAHVTAALHPRPPPPRTPGHTPAHPKAAVGALVGCCCRRHSLLGCSAVCNPHTRKVRSMTSPALLLAHPISEPTHTHMRAHNSLNIYAPLFACGLSKQSGVSHVQSPPLPPSAHTHTHI